MGVNQSIGAELSAQEVVSECMRALILGQAGIVLAAAGFVGQEYEQSCLRTTFLAVPKRIKTLGAKWIVLTTIVALAGIISGLLCLTVGSIQYNCELTFRLVVGFVVSNLLAMISWVQIAWISAGLSMLTKTLVVPIAIMLPLVFSLSQMLYSLFKPAKFLPDLAAINLFFTPKTAEFLDVWSGISVQFVWAVLFGVTSVWLTLRRDVR
jgi:ABC-type transport system involved in multi-copper enzyme maturation permease subunit